MIAGALSLAAWTGLNLTAKDIGNMKLGMTAVLPNLAGLILAFGEALTGGAR